jgi:general secretion pathway protein D
MKRLRHSLLIWCALGLFAIGQAQIPLDLTILDNSFIFSASSPLRYFANYQENLITIPDGVLQNAVVLPAGVRLSQSESELLLTLNQGFRVSLSPDQKTLIVVRGEVLGSAPTLISEDERSPILYRLSNAEPAQLAGLLTRLYDNLKVEVDTRLRALVILVNPGDRPLVDGLIRILDAPQPQVMFEAEILEVNQNLTQSLGIEYSSQFRLSLSEASPASLFGLGDIARSAFSPLQITINALKTTGAADVLARPRITTLDGVEATLNATQNFPIANPNAATDQSVQTLSTGITLRLLPRITPEGMIEARISISVSSPTGSTSQGIPTFSSRDASTTVRVMNGEPIAIGGLFEQRDVTSSTKVPILGDIPILGALFTSNRTDQRQTDLVIIVTPRIVDMPELLTLPVEPIDIGN